MSGSDKYRHKCRWRCDLVVMAPRLRSKVILEKILHFEGEVYFGLNLGFTHLECNLSFPVTQLKYMNMVTNEM